MTTTTQAGEKPAKTAAELIQLLEDGAFDANTADDLRRIIQAMRIAGENGDKATATLTIVLSFQATGTTMKVVGRATAKLPRAKVLATTLWSTGPGDGVLLDPPGQARLTDVVTGFGNRTDAGNVVVVGVGAGR